MKGKFRRKKKKKKNPGYVAFVFPHKWKTKLVPPTSREGPWGSGKTRPFFKFFSWFLSCLYPSQSNRDEANARTQEEKGILSLGKSRHLGSKRALLVVQQVTNPTSVHGDVSSIPGPAPWVKDPALP